MPERAFNLTLDSGAYSAWTKGAQIDLKKYIRFIAGNADSLEQAVNLDVIPGRPGGRPSPSDIDACAAAGLKNLQRMRAAKLGIPILPVYHQGERLYWLEKLIDQGYDYIGISPANDRTTRQKIEWLDEVFGWLCGSVGYPAIKTHGFGVTSIPLIYRYPWSSVDSIRWTLFASYGGLLVPQMRGGEYCYRTATHVYVAEGATLVDGQTVKHGVHLRLLGPAMRKHVLDFFASEGFSEQQVVADKYVRSRLFVRLLLRIANGYTPDPFKVSTGGFFFAQPTRRVRIRDSAKAHVPGAAGVQVRAPAQHALCIMFAGAQSPQQLSLLHQEGARDVLLSYHGLARKKHGFLRSIATGEILASKRVRLE